MKKMFVLTACLFLSASLAFAQGHRQQHGQINSNKNNARQTGKTDIPRAAAASNHAKPAAAKNTVSNPAKIINTNAANAKTNDRAPQKMTVSSPASISSTKQTTRSAGTRRDRKQSNNNRNAWDHKNGNRTNSGKNAGVAKSGTQNNNNQKTPVRTGNRDRNDNRKNGNVNNNANKGSWQNNNSQRDPERNVNRDRNNNRKHGNVNNNANKGRWQNNNSQRNPERNINRDRNNNKKPGNTNNNVNKRPSSSAGSVRNNHNSGNINKNYQQNRHVNKPSRPHGSHNKKFRPKTYYPYGYYYRHVTFRAAINFLLFPFGYVSYSSYYPYDYYYYYPYYRGTAVYNTYNNYSYFTSEKLSADYTMLVDEDKEEEAYNEDEYFDISEIQIRNTRLITANGNAIGFEINNGSGYYVSSISFKFTIRGVDSTDSRSGIFYKLQKTLEPGDKEFCTISLDDLNLNIPETYTVFASIESITTPSGETVTSEE